MHKLKITGVLLVILFLLTCFYGYAGDAPGLPLPGTQKSPVRTADEGKAGLEPYNIVWYLGGAPQTDGERVFGAFNRMLSAKLPNTTVDINMIDWAGYTEKMRIIMASHEKWDMCFTADWTNHFDSAVTRGAFAPIPGEMLEEYGKGILEVLPEEVWGCVMIDGQIMAVPTWQIHCKTSGFGIRKDLYEKYKNRFDFSAVRAKKDFEPFFDLVKANEPGVECFLTEVNNFGTMFDYNVGITFDDLGNGLVVRLDDPSFTVRKLFDQEECISFLHLMRQWYLKGYIAEDASGIDDWYGEQRSGKYAAFEEGNAKPDNDAEFTSIAYPIVDVAFTDSLKSTGTIRNGLFGYSRTAQNLERCIMLTDLMFTDAGLYRLLNHGIEGEHYAILQDGTLKTTGSGYNPGIDWELGNNALAYPRFGQGLDVYDRTRERNADAIRSPLLGWSFDPAPVKDEMIQIQAIYDEVYPALGTGTVEPDPFVGETLERLEKAGLDSVIAEAQRQLDVWLDRGDNRARAEAAVKEYLAGRNGKKTIKTGDRICLANYP